MGNQLMTTENNELDSTSIAFEFDEERGVFLSNDQWPEYILLDENLPIDPEFVRIEPPLAMFRADNGRALYVQMPGDGIPAYRLKYGEVWDE